MLGQVDSRPPQRVPHYAARTITHSAPEYANQEQDIIRQSFHTGNHTWLKEALPTEITPYSVTNLRRHRMEQNRLAEPLPQTWTKMMQLWGGGYYREFEYIPDPYDRQQEAERTDRKDSVDKRCKIADQDWRHTSQEKRCKHEPMIGDVQGKETFPYLGGDYDKEVQARSAPHRPPRWLEPVCTGRHWSHVHPSESLSPKPSIEHSFLAGKGSGLNSNSRESRMMLPQIVLRLQARLDADWEDTTVVVSATDQDLVQVAFHMATVDSERGVLAYMNVLSKDVDFLGNLGLRKVSQLWGMKRTFMGDGASQGPQDSERENPEFTWTFFLLMPQWVRMRPTDAYYTVHPRQEGSAFRMSTAGKSVLMSLGSQVSVDGGGSQSARAGPSQSLQEDGPHSGSQSREPKSARAIKPNLSLISEALSSM